jgi:hypothetical protein
MRLPRILVSGELRPSSYVNPADGARDFLHATSNQNGEKTATTSLQDEYGLYFRRQAYARARFTLDADHFEPWMAVVGRYPEWTPKMIKTLQDRGHKHGSSPYSWYARANPLPLENVVAIHTMTHPDNCWRRLHRSMAEISTVQDTVDVMSIRVGDRIFFSDQYTEPDGVMAYRLRPSAAAAASNQAAE